MGKGNKKLIYFDFAVRSRDSRLKIATVNKRNGLETIMPLIITEFDEKTSIFNAKIDESKSKVIS